SRADRHRAPHPSHAHRRSGELISSEEAETAKAPRHEGDAKKNLNSAFTFPISSRLGAFAVSVRNLGYNVSMTGLETLGFGRSHPRRDERASSAWVQRQQPLRRILSFTRRSIDDVINCPIARNEVIGYYKLYRLIN